MNKTDYNRFKSIYKSGGISETLVIELFINKGLSEVPGLELEHFVVENAIRVIADSIDTFYKVEVFDKAIKLAEGFASQNGQLLTAELTKHIDQIGEEMKEKMDNKDEK